MSDDIDRAQNEIERALGEAMRLRRPTGPAANGFCHYCEEPIGDGARWCNVECREGWEGSRRGR